MSYISVAAVSDESESLSDASSASSILSSPINIVRNEKGQCYELNFYLLRQMLIFACTCPKRARLAVQLLCEDLKKDEIHQMSQLSLEERLCHNLQKITDRTFEDLMRELSFVTQFTSSQGTFAIILTGSACHGPNGSWAAIRLARRLNVPNVVRTETVLAILGHDTNGLNNLDSFKAACRVVRDGISGDLQKAKKNRKSVIVEGLHIDSNLFQDVFPSTDSHPLTVAILAIDNSSVQGSGSFPPPTPSPIEEYINSSQSRFDCVVNVTKEHPSLGSRRYINQMHRAIFDHAKRYFTPAPKSQ